MVEMMVVLSECYKVEYLVGVKALRWIVRKEFVMVVQSDIERVVQMVAQSAA
jgi:hypothetical protein